MAGRDARRLTVLRDWIGRAAREIDADLSVRLWNGETLPLGANVSGPVVLAVNGPDVVRRLLRRPSLLTLAELYAEGRIDVEGGSPLDAARAVDHVAVRRFAARQPRLRMLRSLLPFIGGGNGDGPVAGGTRFEGKVEARVERGRRDKELIAHHYDVSNAFYALFLDPQMVYTNGHFAGADTPLAEAALAKLDQCCRKLRLAPGTRLLDIGCGWGGFACHAARHYGARVHGVTLSDEQLEYARAKVEREGLADLVTLELRDYRDIEPAGQYDAVCQLGMFEHVGMDNHDAFFARVHGLLRPQGLYLHEAITRPATGDLAKFRRRTVYQRFIDRYIFPGGELDHVGRTLTNMERHRLEVVDVEALRDHYRLSLEHWSANLYRNREAAAREAGEPLTRIWLLYLALCTVGFARGVSTVFQIVGARRMARPTGLPLVRDEWRTSPPGAVATGGAGSDETLPNG